MVLKSAELSHESKLSCKNVFSQDRSMFYQVVHHPEGSLFTVTVNCHLVLTSWQGVCCIRLHFFPWMKSGFSEFWVPVACNIRNTEKTLELWLVTRCKAGTGGDTILLIVRYPKSKRVVGRMFLTFHRSSKWFVCLFFSSAQTDFSSDS